VAGAGFWAPELVMGARSLGVHVELATASTEPVRARRAWTLATRVPNRLAVAGPFINEGYGLWAKWTRYDRRDWDAVIAWSSYGLAFTGLATPLVLVRGSSHVRTQRRILSRGPGMRPSRLTVLAERREYRRAAFVTVPTTEIADDPEWRRDGATVVSVPFGFPRSDARIRVPPSARPLRLLFAGEIGWRKGVDRLANALSIRPSWISSFILCGKRAPGARKWVLPSWWTEAGQLQRTAILALLAETDVLVLLSREEGMARVGQEALAQGTPVVATRATGLGRWLGHGAGVLLDDGDRATDVIEALHAVQANWASMSAAALNEARQWSWTDHAQSLLTHLARVTGRPPG
jgi:glycosyltransferase involved in cell wall biosynthesis